MRFSIIIPLYNKGPYVEKALRSVLAQTFTDYELIVVNDGSKDESLAIAKRVLYGSGAIIIDQENAGVSTARNNGVAASHGDYVCFLDADDWWETTFLEELDQLVDDYPGAGIFGTNYYYVKNGRKKVSLDIPTGYINYCKVYAENLCMPLCIGSICVPRSIFNELGGFKSHLKLGEDFDVWIRIALKHKVAFLNKPLFNYNQDVDSAQRGIGGLRDPKNHMLWNMEDLAEEEERNQDFKQLIDNLRVYGLMRYYVTTEYRQAAKQELAKVDWSKQPLQKEIEYRLPIWILVVKYRFLKYGSAIKQRIINVLGYGKCCR